LIPLLLVTGREELRAGLVRSLGEGRPIFTAGTDAEALTLLRTTAVDLIIHDLAVSRDPEALARAMRSGQPGVVLMAAGEAAPEDDDLWQFFLPLPVPPAPLGPVIRQADHQVRLVRELDALRRWAATTPGAAFPHPEAPPLALSHVLKEFAKALSANFDLGQTLDRFLDTVLEMMHPSRVALLLREGSSGVYRIRAQRGLDPQLAESVSLRPETGLPAWLTLHGRILNAPEIDQPLSPYPELRRELQLLRAEVGLPLAAHGELTGILTLGPRITGAPYQPAEVEMLYHLGVNLAAAVQNIALHHQFLYQKRFNEQILAHMANGVITIDQRERVVIYNHRAEEILGRPATQVLGRDLRVLPSPLGDLLYETLSRGTALRKREVVPAALKRPLEVSTYRIPDPAQGMSGAVMVLEDLTPRIELTENRRTAEDLQLLTRIAARLADEIKNPLVSIQTFVELLAERGDDPEFKQRFTSVVGMDVRRLVHIVEKLTSLVTEREYAIEVANAQDVLEESLRDLDRRVQVALEGERETSELLYLHEELTGRSVAVALHSQTGPLPIKCDRQQLRKALTYLLRYLIGKGDEGGKLICSMSTDHEGTEPILDLLLVGRTDKVSEEEIRYLFDPFAMVQDTPLDVGPCVSQRIIEEQGGTLKARRERDGVVFHARFPLARERATHEVR